MECQACPTDNVLEGRNRKQHTVIKLATDTPVQQVPRGKLRAPTFSEILRICLRKAALRRILCRKHVEVQITRKMDKLPENGGLVLRRVSFEGALLKAD